MNTDLTAALRGLRRSPAFTVAAVVTLALGIGANSTMFSLVNSVLLRPLPGYRTDRLMQIADAGIRNRQGFLPPEAFSQLHLQSFETVAANQNCRFNLTGQGEAPEQLEGPCGTANWFDMLGAKAFRGRTFLPGEDQHGRNHVAVLDYAFWQRRFGGDPAIVGKTLTLDGESWQVIGIMPPDFRPAGMNAAPVYTPYVVRDHPHGLNVVGRLKPGVSREAAQAELDVVTASFRAQGNKDLKLRAVPLLEQVTGQQRPLLTLLWGAVSFVFLIACVNVGSLMLARSSARSHEIAIRIAIGARRRHIMRFVLIEALLVSLAACTVSVGVAFAGLRAMAPLTANLPRADELRLDTNVLAVTLALGFMAALLFGALPGWRATRPLSRATPQRWLIAGEVALAFVLLCGAGLLIQTFAAIRAHDLGYDPRHVLTSFLALPEAADGTRTAGVAQYARIRERIARLPGVRGVATASSLPMFGVSIAMEVHPQGEPVHKSDKVASLSVISDDYFRVMAIPLLAGRAFDSRSDREHSTRTAVVSESVSRRHFAGHAVGRRLLLPEFKFNIDGGDEVAPEIVGVVGNVCVRSVEDCDAEHIYLPETQNGLRMENLVVRTESDPKTAVAAVRRAMFEAAATIPLDDPKTMEERASYLSSDPQRAMWLLGVFAGLALVLAAAGIYGVATLLATQRSREIGIRMALGATFRDIAVLVYRIVLPPAAVGLGAGIAVALALSGLLRALLFGVKQHDPTTLLAAAGTLLLVAIVAASIPAFRAAGTDPARVLRSRD